MPVPIPEGTNRRAMAHRLVKLTENAPFTCLRMKQGRLHAAEVVGCIQVGHTRINILPKTDALDIERDKDFLLNLLRAAGFLSQSYTRPGMTRASVYDPIEAILSEMASNMSAAMREGIPRRYEERREDSSTVRGRIDFSKLAVRLPGGTGGLPVRHSPLSIENGLASGIKWIAKELFRLTSSSANRAAFGTILSQLSSVKSQRLSIAKLDTLTLSPNESHWAKSIALARLLLRGYVPDPTSAGKNDGFSLLFPMQYLFERALRSILNNALAADDVRVSHRAEALFLLQAGDANEGVVRLKPDYVFRRNSELIAIADAKWKRVSELGRAHGIKREDLYQINAYLTRYKTSTSIVFVPWAKWMADGWTASFLISETERRIHLVGVDIEKLVSRESAIRDRAYIALSTALDRILIR
jgi:5-methylcytosine-specific restriction enzyme subunit McrC